MSAPATARAPTAAPSAPQKLRSSAKRLRLLLGVPVLFLAVIWGLAKAGVLPVARLTEKNPAARKALTTIGLASPAVKKTAGATPVTAAAPAPAAVAPLQPAAVVPAPTTHPPTRAPRRKSPKDNPGRVARILATMEPDQIVPLVLKMPDSEVAPLILKMNERTAGEILAALPPARAVALARYLRRYQPPDTRTQHNRL